jgi:hypothetical protein
VNIGGILLRRGWIFFQSFRESSSSWIYFGGFSSGAGFSFLTGGRWRVLLGGVKFPRQFKCLCCNEITLYDVRNRGRQRYCGKVDCRRVSKAASQRVWLGKPENRDYFRGRENVERVRQWRAAHPGYWKRSGNKKPRAAGRLQDSCPVQAADNKQVMRSEISTTPDALQEISGMQSTVLVGLISSLTGDTLQEDIVARVRLFSSRGQDILRMRGASPPYEKNTPLSRSGSDRAGPV